MRIIRRWNIELFNVCLAIVIAGLTVSCSSALKDDEPEEPNKIPPSETPRIEIYAGSAPITVIDGTSASRNSLTGTRSSTEPSRLGYCNADRLHIWIYKTKALQSGISNTVKSPPFDSQITLSDFNISGPYNSERFFTSSYSFDMVRDSRYCGFAIPSIAYECKDETLFEYNFDSKNAFTLLGLSIRHDGNGINNEEIDNNLYHKEFRTPELFFGYLKFRAIREVQDRLEDLVTVSPENQYFYIFTKNTDDKYTFQEYLNGKVYRIVSQCNVNLTEIDSDEVERMELFLSNVPVKLQLSGSHGTYYNVTASEECFEKGYDDTKDLADNYVRVAATSDFSGGTARLSCFLLPSLKGREMCIRVYYKRNRLNEAGEVVEYEDFKIQPKRDVMLYGDDAAVYARGEVKKQTDLWQDDNLYLYNSETGRFFSYANIRVNLSGRFSDLVSDKVSTGFNLSVSSEFEEEHNIKLK